MPDKDLMLRVGVISSTHGLRGEVKVYPTTEDVSRFDFLDLVFLDRGKDLLELHVESVKYFKNMVILKFKGYDRIEDIERFCKMDLLVTRENAIPLEEGEYFVYDLIGLPVYEEDGKSIGTLREVLQTAANDVYLITDPTGKEILVPSIPDSRIKIDLQEKKIVLHLLPGLVD